MAGGVSAEEAVLAGEERPKTARKRPTAVKRAVLKARAARAAAEAAEAAAARTAALAAARAAHGDVQRQYDVRAVAPAMSAREPLGDVWATKLVHAASALERMKHSRSVQVCLIRVTEPEFIHAGLAVAQAARRAQDESPAPQTDPAICMQVNLC